MVMSKHQLARFLSKKTLTLEGKIKLLDSNKKRKQSCRQLAEQFNIKKTAAAKIIKNEASIRKEYKLFKGNLQRKRKEQFHDINEILHTWFVNCCTANVYPDGPMLREEAKEKPLMDNPPCHPESLSDPFSNVKVVFLPKNTMSRLQPFVRNFKVRYRKKLLKFVISKIDNIVKATDIIQEVDVLNLMN